MADAIVIGSGVAGLGAALLLARRGRTVEVLERDDPPVSDAPGPAFEAASARRGVPQSRHSHAFLARARNLLAAELPDVLERLLANGATEIRFCSDELLPPGIDDRTPREGDDELVGLACRRTTFEWALRAAAAAEEGIHLRPATAAAGLVVGPADGPDGLPAVTGVELEGGARLLATTTIDASGRRSGLPAWLADAGIRLPDDQVVESGILYCSRFYRFAPGRGRPEGPGHVGGDLGYLSFGVFPGDDGTFSLTFGVPTDDEALRALSDPEAFDTAARAIPGMAPWIEPDRAAPISDVAVMARLTNRRRRLVVDGRPLVLGLHAIGDALVHTNPLYGRGCSLGLVHALGLAEAIAAHEDPVERALADAAHVEAQIVPWLKAAIAQDRQGIAARAARAAARTSGEPVPPDPSAELFRDGVMAAVQRDAVVFRAFVRVLNLLERPDALMADPDLVGRVLATYGARADRPPAEPLGPDEPALLALLGVAA